MHTLIIGGSRGIGWELGLLYAKDGDKVAVTGRKAPNKPNDKMFFKELDLSTSDYADKIKTLIDDASPIDRLVYAAGYYQEGTVTDLSETEIQDMVQVCGTGFIYAARAILLKQGKLPECIVITSSSQWVARELEPVYNFAKAGLGHFAESLSMDKRVGKLLVAGPAGTKTDFWASNKDKDVSTYNDPDWVAKQMHDCMAGNFRYKFIKILRNPAEVEISAART